MNVLVTGGTGALGREVVNELRGSGHRARVLSRMRGIGHDWAQGDLASGKGLDKALTDMDVVIHAGSAAREPWRLKAVDVDGTRRLIDAAKLAGVRHLVFISIVGMEGIAYPYYASKLKAESVVKEGTLPWTILRATQFHTLMETFLKAFAILPRIAAIPVNWQFQPVDTRDVAARLVQVAGQEPQGMLPDFGGPEVRTFKSLADSWLQARHMTRRVVNFSPPLKFSRQVAEGKLLTPDHKDGTITFEQYLIRKYGKW
jgi:uncharacterized protein YbjT (DUF2867 family)